MSTTYIPAELRRLVRERAGYRCEYCHIPETVTYYGCHVDHIIAEKHGGQTTAENLALACGYCNVNKGSDLGSLATRTGILTRFFNPRTDQWANHFQIEPDGLTIVPTTDIGEVTARIFGFNEEPRLDERRLLLTVS